MLFKRPQEPFFCPKAFFEWTEVIKTPAILTMILQVFHIFIRLISESDFYFAPRLFSTSFIISLTSNPTCTKFLYRMRSRSSLDLNV